MNQRDWSFAPNSSIFSIRRISAHLLSIVAARHSAAYRAHSTRGSSSSRLNSISKSKSCHRGTETRRDGDKETKGTPLVSTSPCPLVHLCVSVPPWLLQPALKSFKFNTYD